jgi:ATP-dependent Clp protease, protease subunit
MSTNRKSIKTLRSDRVIFINGEITEASAAETVRQLLALDKKPYKDILLVVHSDGGGATDGLYLINCFKLIKSNIAVLVPSNAQSTATIILAAGKKGKRIIMPGAVAMMHSSIYSLSETSHTVQRREVEHQEKMEHYYNKILVDRGYKYPEHGLTSEYNFYIGQEIIEAGLADIMIDSLEELNSIINL